jgi:hypothetical protein
VKHIIKKLALLFVPVYLWFAFFVAFEPNNYFGIKKTASSSQPVARVRAYEQSPGTNLIIGDSRLAHFDMDLVDSRAKLAEPGLWRCFPEGMCGPCQLCAGFRQPGGPHSV